MWPIPLGQGGRSAGGGGGGADCRGMAAVRVLRLLLCEHEAADRQTQGDLEVRRV